MKSSIWTVFKKEVRENVRDRRTMLSAFLFVPLFGPLLFAAMTGFMVDRVAGEADEKLRVVVIGAEHAPNLIGFLEQNDADIVRFDSGIDAARLAIREGRENFVLSIPPTVGEQLKAGSPAVIDLIWDSSDNKAQRHVMRARALLDGYGRTIGSLRLLARGVDPSVVQAIDLRTVDLATPSGRSMLLLGTLTYLLVFSLLMGGLYLAIDVTAGERERGSLESLLCLPIRRSDLVFGKIGATGLFMMASLTLSLIVLVVVLRALPLEKLGMASNFTPLIALKIGAFMAPLAVFGSGLLFVVGSFTRSYREAQTWLGALLAVPTLPILFASVANVRPTTLLMSVPSLSQHLLATSLLRGDVVEPLHVAVSVCATLTLGLCLIWVATKLYQREKLLG